MQRRALSRKRPASPSPDSPAEHVQQRELSPRQHQILDMLRAGKVNKEIAKALGIGLGTVKQHVVALFKKLDVSNRAMAVSRGMQIQAAPRTDAVQGLASDGMLEYRPCVVLSASLDESMPPELGRKMQQVLAAYAYDHDALFLARKGHAGDLILGIQRASEQDLYLALRAARTVFGELSIAGVRADSLKGGLTAGLAVASMNRTGGWSGEAIASIAITQGREYANAAEPGQLKIAPAAGDLLCVQNPNLSGSAPESLPFATLENLPWQPGGTEALPLGRESELRLIEESTAKAKAATGSLIQLAGETGMGKSRLCRYAAQLAAEAGGKAYHVICRPDGDPAIPFVSPGGSAVSPSALFRFIASPPMVRPEVVLVDDCHFLPPNALAELVRQAAASQSRFILLAARRFVDSGTRPTHAVRLGRLGPDAIERLTRATLGSLQTPAKIASIVRRAAGVPLFAIELARQRRSDLLPLSLRVLIGARLDALKLDRALLRRIARSRAACSVQGLAREMNEPQESVQAAAALALASGVLSQDGAGKLRFAHPLLRQAVDLAGVE